MTAARRAGLIAVAIGTLVGCGTAALPQNGAFAMNDDCDRVVLEAIGEHPEIHWVQRRTAVGLREYVDTAQGFAPGENVQPTRQWSRYRRSGGALSEPGVLTGVVWETDPLSRVRRARTDYITLACSRP